MINFNDLVKAQKAGNVLNSTPPEGALFDESVPAELIEQYYAYHQAKSKFNAVLRKHGMMEV